jgi:hypothetical protein
MLPVKLRYLPVNQRLFGHQERSEGSGRQKQGITQTPLRLNLQYLMGRTQQRTTGQVLIGKMPIVSIPMSHGSGEGISARQED